MTLLEIRKLSQHFGGVAAVNRLDFDVFDSEILGLIGPNGAGKTTLFNVISGFYRPSTGTVTFKGQPVSGLRPDEIAKKGIGRTFQQTVLFMRSTAFENVMTGFHMRYRGRLLQQFLHTRFARGEENGFKKKASEILEFMGLSALQEELAQNLPHGHQRTLGICVALAANPRLLLLDEPLTGMNPTEALTTLEHIRRLKERGITIIIVEHNMKAVMSLCERLVVLNHGEKIAEGTCEEIQDNRAVIEAYLGKERKQCCLS